MFSVLNVRENSDVVPAEKTRLHFSEGSGLNELHGLSLEVDNSLMTFHKSSLCPFDQAHKEKTCMFFVLFFTHIYHQH